MCSSGQTSLPSEEPVFLSVKLGDLVLVVGDVPPANLVRVLAAAVCVAREARGEARGLGVGHRVGRVLVRGKRAGPHRVPERREAAARLLPHLREDAAEPGHVARVVRVRQRPQEVRVHQDLAVAAGAGADAHARHGERPRERGADGRRHALGDDGERARPLQREGLVDEAPCPPRRAALRAEAARHGDGLRRQAHVAHHGDARVDERLHGRGDARGAALDLDAVGAALLDGAVRRAQRYRWRLLVGAERQVHHEQRRVADRPQAAARGAAVVQHLVERHGPRVGVAQRDHAERVAAERHVDAGGADVRGRRVVMRRHHADLLAEALHAQQAHGRDLAPRRRSLTRERADGRGRRAPHGRASPCGSAPPRGSSAECAPQLVKVTVGPTKSRSVFLPRRSAYVRRPRLARVNDASEKKIATVDPRRTRRTRAPRGHHHPSTAYCPVDGVF